MNIAADTIKQIEQYYSVCFFDKYINNVTPDKAVMLHIGWSKDGEEYTNKTIKETKRETTFAYVMEQINKDKTYANFSNQFNKVISKLGLSAYPTTYGIGVFVAIGFRNSIDITKNLIYQELKKLDIDFTTEYSEANWVFRYKISKSKENINKLNNIAL